jgi:hypothetical protein
MLPDGAIASIASYVIELQARADAANARVA